ncbi:MAG: hypothetical protein ACYS0G_08245 [Planctomycetota bacterium]|jgi:hypothetical protein
MTEYTRMWPVPLVAVVALFLGTAGWDDGDDGDDEILLDEAKVFIEFNSTDEDFGIQFFWDGEPWEEMEVEGPKGKTVLEVEVSRNVKAQGLTEGFFESAEPPVDELPMEEFLDRFPEGDYEFEGETLEGDELVGEAEFTHIIPAPPEDLFPEDGDMVDSMNPLVATFTAVTEDLDGEPLTPELYEVVVENENDILRVFSIILAGDVAFPSVTVPPEFLEPGTYKLEVIVQEETGNRTIAETEFLVF